MVARSDKEWETRTLCSDGNCIGVVGSDGRCKVCGLAYEGTLPASMDDAYDDEVAAEDVPADSPASEAAVHEEDDQESETNDAWEERTLCIDESCIGIVGADGRCKECGKLHPEKQP